MHDTHCCTRVPFYEVENNCGYHLFESDHEEEEEEATEKKEEEPTKKKSAFHVSSTKESSQWVHSLMAFDLIHLLSLTLVKSLVWCLFLAGIQCLGHQLEEGSEGPEERDKGNKKERKEKNKERAAETTGWENDQEFTLCPLQTGLNSTNRRKRWFSFYRKIFDMVMTDVLAAGERPDFQTLTT